MVICMNTPIEPLEDINKACAENGPLETTTCRLVRIALAIGGNNQIVIQGHVKRALEEGVSADKIRHVAILTRHAYGLAHAMAALNMVDEILDPHEAKKTDALRQHC